jgi:hypothetical protein
VSIYIYTCANLHPRCRILFYTLTPKLAYPTDQLISAATQTAPINLSYAPDPLKPHLIPTTPTRTPNPHPFPRSPFSSSWAAAIREGAGGRGGGRRRASPAAAAEEGLRRLLPSFRADLRRRLRGEVAAARRAGRVSRRGGRPCWRFVCLHDGEHFPEYFRVCLHKVPCLCFPGVPSFCLDFLLF